MYYAQVKYEDDDQPEEKYRIPENDRPNNDQPPFNNYDAVPHY